MKITNGPRSSLPLFAALLAVGVTLTGCKELKGLQVGNVRLDPLISAGEKLANTGDINEQQEVQLGGDMAATLLGAARLSKDQDMQRYVNRVGRFVALQSERPDLPWRFGVIDDGTFNAFAAPGGYIFVTRGLLKSLESEAELAGVLAHEIAHVVRKHHLKAVQKNNQLGALSDVLMGAADYRVSQGGVQNAYLKRQIADRLLNATRELYARGLDQGDEFEADRDAMQLAARAGYDPYAYLVVMQRIEMISPQDSGFALMFSTHPKPAERLAALGNVTPAWNGTAINAERYGSNVLSR